MENPYKTHGKLEANVLKRLIAYMQYHGIVYNPNLVAGVGFGAELRLLIETNKQVHVRINKNVDIIWKANYLLSTNSQADDAQKFASIIHELGHFFCHHLPAPIGWGVAWDVRNLSHEAEEFEAEATARIICDRLNIKNQSERYLSSYLDEHEELPEGVSVENICYAANKILVMCSGAKFTYRDGLLFKHNKEFKNIEKNISKKDSKL
jgi:Zn-dependent peptidase ImmA (M78 family)